MEYSIAYEWATSEHEAMQKLVNTVCAECKKGWRPQGGVCVVQTDDSSIINVYQAMVREDEETKKEDNYNVEEIVVRVLKTIEEERKQSQTKENKIEFI